MNSNNNPQTIRSIRTPFVLVAITTLAAIAISIYCLLSGWVIIFQNIFYFPIIIACMYYKKKGFIFSTALSIIYFLLVMVFTKDPAVIMQALIRAFIFAGIAGIVTNLSIKRRQGEAVLTESETRYRNIFESSRDAIMTLEPPSWGFTSGNPATVEMFRAKDEAEFISYGPGQLSPARQPDGRDSGEKAGEMIGTAMREGSHFFEWTHKRINGKEFPATVLLTRMELAGKSFLQAMVRDTTELKRAEDQLRERVKELQTFFSLSEINEREGISLEELYQELANALPKSWKYAEIACARIVIGSREFRTKNFTESKWLQSAPVKASKTAVGRIDVGYLEERPKQDEGPFLKEERRLIDAIAERLGRITERKRVEEALQESEQRFKTVIDNSNDGFLLADMETKRFFIGNKTISQMLGYSPDEIKGLGVMDIHPPEDMPHVVDQFEKQARKEIDIAKDLPVVRKDGSIFYADVSAFPITLAGKSYLVGAFRDTSERKRIEDALRQSEERFRVLFEQAADCIFILEIMPKGIPVIRDANHASMKLLGYERGELIGQPISFIDAASNATKVVDERRVKVLSGSGTLVFEVRHRCKDGTVRDFECSVKEMQIGTKTISISVERDITERKRTEAALKESEVRYRELVEKAGIAILVDDVEGNFKYYNKRFAELFGYAHSEMGGMSYPQIVHPDDLSRVTKYRNAMLQNKAAPGTYEFKGIKNGNALIPIEANVTPLTEGERIIGIRSYFWDISDRKQVEEELRLQSIHDILTGLYNRRGFFALTNQQRTVADRTGKGFFIVYADLDKMKKINDVHGHAVGDQALKAIAEILTASFRKSDVIGRLGGDEFAVCASEALPDSAPVMINRIKNNLDNFNQLLRLKVSLSLSIGTSFYDPKQPCSIDELIERADRIMYIQKNRKDGNGL